MDIPGITSGFSRVLAAYNAAPCPSTSRSCHRRQLQNYKALDWGENPAFISRRGVTVHAADDLVDSWLWYIKSVDIATSPLTTWSERIPVPDLGLATVPYNLVTENERRSLQTVFNQSNDRPVKGRTTHGQAQGLVQSLKQLLNPDDLSQYNFKPLQIQQSSHVASSAARSALPSFQPRLSPLARMLFDSSEVTFRYPTPATSSSELSADPQSIPTPTSSGFIGKSVDVHNYNSFQQNRGQHLYRQQVVVEVPSRSPNEILRESPKMQKLNPVQQLPQSVTHYHAQREEVEATLFKFKDFLLEIFEALDRRQSISQHASVQETSPYLEESDSPDDSIRLATKVHSKLQHTIKKLTTSKTFNGIPSDDVERLQRVCEESIVGAQTMNLQIVEDPTDEDVNHWKACITRAENGLTSACTLSWTILGSLEHKKQCPEHLVQSIPILLTNVFESCLIPVIEARSTGRSSSLFRIGLATKEILTRLLYQGRKLLSLIADICLQMESIESVITRIEYLATQLIFVESAHTEKGSVLGVQPFELVRKAAMEVLAKIFSKFADQRQSILDEILSSLQKLSTTKQGARQFKLADGKNIQLVSALVMHLVQTVACDSSSQVRASKVVHLPAKTRRDQTVSDSGEEDLTDDPSVNEEFGVLGTQNFGDRARLLHQKALESANYIMNYLVQRAKVSSKTGDQPHRNLLDLFTEDLIRVLSFPDWPAAELLLWLLARHMLAILNDEKSPAIAKNMALELLGWMGSAITGLLILAHDLSANVEKQDDQTGPYLADLARDQLKGSLQVDDIVTDNGPFRLTLEYLSGRDGGDWQTQTAQGYYLNVWAYTLLNHIGEEKFDQSEGLSRSLSQIAGNPAWLENNACFENITSHHARLAYLVTLMTMGFCKTFDVIVNVLLHSVTSDQAKVRSRSLKSVIAMLEADPKLLDRDAGIMTVIFRCASDPSSMVRDNALSLIAKCMSLRPVLEEEATRVILERGQSDAATGVRKRCVAILKDVYLRNTKSTIRAVVSRFLLCRLLDPEETVASFAKQALFEVWVSPFVATTPIMMDNAKAQVALIEQVHLIVKTVTLAEQGNTSEVLSQLEQFLRTGLDDSRKNRTSVSVLCSNIVDRLFDLILNSSDKASKQEQRALLSTLQAFAKADSSLVRPEQLQALQPYIQNLSSDDDLFFFRSVVVIYRCVLPCSTDKILLKAVQNDLMRAISKLGRAELDEAVTCLWTIDQVLHNTERLVKLTMSLLKNIHGTKLPRSTGVAETGPPSGDVVRRLRSYLRITGCIGKHCDLEPFANSFREIFPSWKGTSVVGLMVDLILPLTTTESPAVIRSEALHSLASICQTWPGQFNKDAVRRPISSVLQGRDSDLQHIILTSFLEFFGGRETAGENDASIGTDGKDGNGGRLESSLKASDHDGAAALIAQHFLTFILRLSLCGNEQIDLLATRVMASISRQGLVHPKECAGTLVALETSPRLLLAQIACESHRLLHQRHETMFEREYMRAIREAYEYQRDVIHDPAGAKSRPFTAKLSSLYDMVKTSNAKYVRKFLKNLVVKASIDLADLVPEKDHADQLLFSRFVVQNLAFFEYGKVDELVHTISVIESHVGKAGGEIAQAIEAQGTSSGGVIVSSNDNPKLINSVGDTKAATNEGGTTGPPMQHLTIAAMMLTMLWETRNHLRRQYGLTGTGCDAEGKGRDAKELAKSPIKIHGISGDRLWEKVAETMKSLDGEEAMLSRCRAFVELMAVDDEVKVAAEVDEMRDAYSASVDRESSLPPMGNANRNSNGKRKSAPSATSTPKKKRGRPSLNSRRKQSTNLDSDEGYD